MSQPAAPRICTKLAFHGRAKQRGVLATLYLKVALPVSIEAQRYPLIPARGVTLQRWHVHALNVNQQAPALDASAASAAAALRIAISADDDSFNKAKPPKVVVADSHILLSSPAQPCFELGLPSTSISKSSKGFRNDKRWFMITLQIHIAYALQPPADPHLVRVPLPKCLNNYCRFVIEDDAQIAPSDSGMVVEVDPPLLPRGKRPTREEIDLDDGTATQRAESEYGSDDEDDDYVTLAGRFFGGSGGITIRWSHAAETGKQLPVLSVDDASTLISVSTLDGGPWPDGLRIVLRGQIQLDGIHLPMLSSAALLSIDMEATQVDQVDTVIATGGLLDWHARTAAVEEDEKFRTQREATPKSSLSRATVNAALDTWAVENHGADESDIWRISPPVDLNASEFDITVESTDRRRAVLASCTSPFMWWQNPDQRLREGKRHDGIDLLFDPGVVCGHSGELPLQPLCITFRAIATVAASASKQGMGFCVPAIRVRNAIKSSASPAITSDSEHLGVDAATAPPTLLWKPREPLSTPGTHLPSDQPLQTHDEPSLSQSQSMVIRAPQTGPASDASIESAVLRAGSPDFKTAHFVCSGVAAEVFVDACKPHFYTMTVDLPEAMFKGSALVLTFIRHVENVQVNAGGQRMSTNVETSKDNPSNAQITLSMLPPGVAQLKLQWTSNSIKSSGVIALPSLSFDIDRFELSIHDTSGQTWSVQPNGPAPLSIYAPFSNARLIFGLRAGVALVFTPSGATERHALAESNPPGKAGTIKLVHADVATLAERTSRPAWTAFAPWILLAFVSCSSAYLISTLQRNMQRLESEVQLLSMAADVDFSQGSWTEPAASHELDTTYRPLKQPSPYSSDHQSGVGNEHLPYDSINFEMLATKLQQDPQKKAEDAHPIDFSDSHANSIDHPRASIFAALFSPLFFVLDSIRNLAYLFAP